MKLSSAQWEAETCAQASMLMSICRGSRKVLLQRQNGLRGGHCEDRAGSTAVGLPALPLWPRRELHAFKMPVVVLVP